MKPTHMGKWALALALCSIYNAPLAAQNAEPIISVGGTGGGSGGSGDGSFIWGLGTGNIADQTDVQPILTPGFCVDITGDTLSAQSTCFPAIYTSASAPTDGVDACNTGDLWNRTGTVQRFSCADGDTDTWVQIPTLSSGVLPVAQGGTGLSSGTSGGVLSYTASGTLASSGALTANLPVIGGGAGVAPSSGARSGNTTTFVTTTGTQTSGDCVSIDANGNHVASGSACGGGSSFDPVDEDTAYMRDDFVGGSTSAGTLYIGNLNWYHQQSGTSTLSYWSTASWPHHGVFRMATNSSAGTNYSAISFTSVGSLVGLAGNTDKSWALKWVFSLADTANVRYRIGLCGNANNIVPAEFIGVRYDTNASYDDDGAGSGNMFFASVTSSTPTTLTTGVAAGSTYRTLTIASDNYQNGGSNTNRIWMRIDAGTWVSVYSGSSDINAAPPSGNLTPCAIVGNDTTTSKALDLDFFAFKASVTR